MMAKNKRARSATVRRQASVSGGDAILLHKVVSPLLFFCVKMACVLKLVAAVEKSFGIVAKRNFSGL